MLMGLLFAASIVMLLRFIQPERLLRVESLPDITDFFATLQSPITPLLPSFWAGETLFASLQGGRDLLHAGALWTTALAPDAARPRAAHERWHFAGFSKRAGSAEGALHAAPHGSIASCALLPLSAVRRQLLVKDVKVFLRDVSQWSQLLLLLALVLVYLYNFRVLDLERDPVHERRHQERLRVRQPRDGRLRDGDGRGAVRVSRRVGRGRGVLDHPHGARSRCATSCGRSSGPGSCRCSC